MRHGDGLTQRGRIRGSKVASKGRVDTNNHNCSSDDGTALDSGNDDRNHDKQRAGENGGEVQIVDLAFDRENENDDGGKEGDKDEVGNVENEGGGAGDGEKEQESSGNAEGQSTSEVYRRARSL